jgi:hypothetical protein
MESHQDPAALYPDRIREATAEGYPWWGLPASRFAQDLGWDYVPTRLLLANCGGGH